MSGSGRGRGWLNIPSRRPPPEVIPGGLQDMERQSPKMTTTTTNSTTNVPIQQEPRQINLCSLLGDPMEGPDAAYLDVFRRLERLGPLPPPTTLKDELDEHFDRLIEVLEHFNNDLRLVEFYYKNVLINFNLSYNVPWATDRNPYPQYSAKYKKFQPARSYLVGLLQESYEQREQIHEEFPHLFRNYTKLMWERVKQSMRPMANQLLPATLDSLELLINSQHLEDVQLCAQLFTEIVKETRSPLKSEYYDYCQLAKKENMDDRLRKISIKARRVLINDTISDVRVKAWLLLIVDLVTHDFGQLPLDSVKLYEEFLGGTIAMTTNRPPPPVDELSVQTAHSSRVLDAYESDVNVLQISTSPIESDLKRIHFDQHNPSDSLKDINMANKKFHSPRLGGGSVFNNVANKKGGRPILGSGARAASGDARKKSSGGIRGWDHDDRFETDYS